MKIIAWNCQGMGSSLTEKALRRLIRKYDPEILFIMETHQKKKRISFWKRQLKFDQCVVVNPINTSSGGLALFWKSSAQVSVIESNANVIDTLVYFTNEGNFHL